MNPFLPFPLEVEEIIHVEKFTIETVHNNFRQEWALAHITKQKDVGFQEDIVSQTIKPFCDKTVGYILI